VTELPKVSNFAAPAARSVESDLQRVGVVEGVVGGEQQLASLAALFPNLRFESIGAAWPDTPAARYGAVIVPVDAAMATDVDAAVRKLNGRWSGIRVIAALKDADVTTTRLLMREGCANVVPAPTTEAALALSLDALFGAHPKRPAGGGKAGEVVAFLKAGGGVGATALAVQTAALIAAKGGRICVADLDLQFGAAGIYLDLPEAATVIDVLSAGAGMQDLTLAGTLAKHRTGLNLLAAPRQLTPLEALSPAQIDGVVGALKRDFELTLLDLPAVWTAWTNRALQLADRIVIVTHLSVPHLHMVDRQLQVLKTQGLDGRNLTVVCNAMSPDRTASLSLKAAERALGREMTVLPEDRKIMNAAINQGVELAAIRRGTKLEAALGQLATRIAPASYAEPAGKRR